MPQPSSWEKERKEEDVGQGERENTLPVMEGKHRSVAREDESTYASVGRGEPSVGRAAYRKWPGVDRAANEVRQEEASKVMVCGVGEGASPYGSTREMLTEEADGE
jgi:hypothetical protein